MAEIKPFKANGNIVIPNTNTCSVETFDMQLRTLSDGSTWVRIFHHNNRSGTVLFEHDNSALWCSETDRYSRLSALELYRHPGGWFEFMILQPDDTPDIIFRFKQTSNPTVEGLVTGYETITGYTGIILGLNRSIYNVNLADYSTFIRESSGGWWGAIGAFSSYTGTGGKIGIPGFGTTIVSGSLDLYVRVDNLLDDDKVHLAEKCLYTSDIIEL